ncbi:MAG: XdhC family protein [Pseudomonadota bacterium]|nr:XdhC family protein [Pseudomonadota bacterium]
MGIYEVIERYLSENRVGILATVIYRAGSAPRDVGAKMFVGEDGKIYGTVGGGRLESDARSEALRIMGKPQTDILHIRMDGKEVAADGMLCGGDVDILLEPVSERYRDLYKAIGNFEKKGKKGLIVTKLLRHHFSKTFIDIDLKCIGDELPEGEIISLGRHFDDKKPLISEGVVIEPLQVSTVLYIFGAGHISQYISKIAKLVDFYVVVIDDRTEFANRERFPEADEIIVKDFKDIFNNIRFTGAEFVTIVTRGHAYDADVLRETLQRKVRYVGMIGSKRKVKIILEYMKKCGFDEGAIESVHAPIGLSINAETPQEIAVSIVAELIKIRGEV